MQPFLFKNGYREGAEYTTQHNATQRQIAREQEYIKALFLRRELESSKKNVPLTYKDAPNR